jgi:hypothetical protein
VREEISQTDPRWCASSSASTSSALQAWTWFQQPFMSGVRVEVADSTFSGACTGVTVANTEESSFVVADSTFRESVLYGFNFADLKTSRFEARRSRFESWAGIYIWPGDLGVGVADSVIHAVNNEFLGAYGFLTDTSWSPVPGAPLFVGDMDCLLVANSVDAVSQVGYVFAPGTYGCHVVGRVGGSVEGDLSGHVIHDVPVKGAASKAR